MPTIKDRIYVCDDCFPAIVNGDFTGLDYSYARDKADQRQAEIIGGMERLTSSGDQLVCGNDTITFSKTPCGCCQSYLHGRRHEVSILATSRTNLEVVKQI